MRYEMSTAFENIITVEEQIGITKKSWKKNNQLI